MIGVAVQVFESSVEMRSDTCVRCSAFILGMVTNGGKHIRNKGGCKRTSVFRHGLAKRAKLRAMKHFLVSDDVVLGKMIKF